MTAIEMDPQYCLALRGRGSSNGFRVRCSDYRAVAHALARADYVTWWMGGDNNKWLLVDLQGARALSGEIPRVGARVAIPFDMRYNPDVESWHAMRPLADWSKRVEVDECALCLARQSKSAFERAVAESYTGKHGQRAIAPSVRFTLPNSGWQADHSTRLPCQASTRLDFGGAT